jgi:hypothetical protein
MANALSEIGMEPSSGRQLSCCFRVSYPQSLMEMTAEPLCEECLKGRLNGGAVFALVRGQVPHGDERIEPYVGHANRNPPKFLIVLPRAIFW